MRLFMGHRVVITGLGPVTPIAIGAAAFHAAQLAGKSGVGMIQKFDTSKLKCRFAAEVNIDFTDYGLEIRELKRLDRYVQFTLVAAELARLDSGLSLEELQGDQVGTLIGTGIGGMETFENQTRVMIERGADRLSPFFIPMMIANMATGHVAMRYGSTGVSSSVVTACSTSTVALHDAYHFLNRGDCEVMIAGGSEASVTPLSIGAFGNMGALSTRNDSPETASRPFSASRDGFVMGEGAGILILETLEHAQKRGAKIYAELLGAGLAADAYHITAPAPEGRGYTNAIKRALKNSKVNADQIGYANLHGTSTPMNDLAETQGMKAVFGDHIKKLATSSTKSMTGHLLGAAGAVEAIATVQALDTGILPPTINYIDADPECDLDYIPNTPREQQVEYAISNSNAFGGQNACAVFKRWSE
jgi:3-oxoacyl-[acyl-carrier-protein] synthase II